MNVASFVAETLSISTMQRTAKLGSWEQIMYFDIVRSQIFILWPIGIVDVIPGGSGC